MENNHINAPPSESLSKYGQVISGRTKDADLYAFLQALGKGKAKWIEAACYIAWQTEIKKGVSILQRAETHRAAEVEQSKSQQQ